MANNISKKPLISLQNIHLDYHVGNQVVKALNGVSLSIKKGSFWAIMGSSGSGKSTLMNVLGCLDQPSEGKYFLNGENVVGLNDSELSDVRLRELGFIFQSFNLIPQLTVLENIELPLYYLGIDAYESSKKATIIAEKVGLKDRLHHRPMELSGGQQQRVAIARSLVNNPSILLADEPTGNLDSATGKQIMTLLSELNEQGKTIIMVTHDFEDANYAHKRLHMKDGIIDYMEGE